LFRIDRNLVKLGGVRPVKIQSLDKEAGAEGDIPDAAASAASAYSTATAEIEQMHEDANAKAKAQA